MSRKQSKQWEFSNGDNKDDQNLWNKDWYTPSWHMFFATYAVHLFELLSNRIGKTGDKVLTKWQ